MSYFVYILQCVDKTYYCGCTVDLDRRVDEHNKSKKGAKYTKNRRPVTLKYFEKFSSLNEALRREYAIKKLNREEKIKLIAGQIR